MRESRERLRGLSMKKQWSNCDLKIGKKPGEECPGRRNSKYRGPGATQSWFAWRLDTTAVWLEGLQLETDL